MPADSYAAAEDRAKDKHAQDQHITMSHRDWVILDRHRLMLAERWAETFTKWDVVLFARQFRTLRFTTTIAPLKGKTRH